MVLQSAEFKSQALQCIAASVCRFKGSSRAIKIEQPKQFKDKPWHPEKYSSRKGVARLR